MYAYKRGDYRRCLHLSTQNFYTLLYAAVRMRDVPIFPEFAQLLDDNIVSLTALMLIVRPKCRNVEDGYGIGGVCISQLTLTLYLMTQCQLKLRHSVTKLTRTLDGIELVQRRRCIDRTLDHLTLRLNARFVLSHIRNSLSSQ